MENDFSENIKDLFYNTLCNKVKLKDSEKFYSTFYTHIMQEAEVLFPAINVKHSRVFLMKFSEMFWDYVNKKEKAVVETSHSISERELTGLQYLGGYVIHKLHKKIKSSKSWKNEEYQDAIAILEACRGEVTNQKLTLDRGGLWGISNSTQKLFGYFPVSPTAKINIFYFHIF